MTTVSLSSFLVRSHISQCVARDDRYGLAIGRLQCFRLAVIDQGIEKDWIPFGKTFQARRPVDFGNEENLDIVSSGPEGGFRNQGRELARTGRHFGYGPDGARLLATARYLRGIAVRFGRDVSGNVGEKKGRVQIHILEKRLPIEFHS